MSATGPYFRNDRKMQMEAIHLQIAKFVRFMPVLLALVLAIGARSLAVEPLDCLDVPEFGLPRRRVALLFRTPAHVAPGHPVAAVAARVEAMVYAPLRGHCVLYEVYRGNTSAVPSSTRTVISLPAEAQYVHPLDVVGALAARGACEVVVHSHERTHAAALLDPLAVLIGSATSLAALAAPNKAPCALELHLAPPLVASTLARGAGEPAATRTLDRCARVAHRGARRRVALAFFGINRSLRLTIESLQVQLFARLHAECVPFDVYLHTYTDALVDNPRAHENNVSLPGAAEMIELLKPIRHALSTAAEADLAMPIARFTARGLAYPAVTTRNLLRQYYSLSHVTALWAERRSEYVAVAYVRPDLMLVRPLDVVAMLSSQRHEVVVPYWHAWGGLNDRLAFGHPDAMLVWGARGEHAAEFARTWPLHAERLLLWVVTKRRKLTLRYTSLLGLRVRATGAIQDACLPHQCRAATKRCLGVCSRADPERDCFGCRGGSVDPACHADHRACGKGRLATSRCLVRTGGAPLPARRAKKGDAARVELCGGHLARFFQSRSSNELPADGSSASALDAFERPPNCAPTHVPLSDLPSHRPHASRSIVCVTRHPVLRVLDEYNWLLDACGAGQLSERQCRATLSAREADTCDPRAFLRWVQRSLSAARLNLYHGRCRWIPQTRFLSATCGRPTIGANASAHGCDVLVRAEDVHDSRHLPIESLVSTLSTSAGQSKAVVALCSGRALLGAAGKSAFARALGLDTANASAGTAARPTGMAPRPPCTFRWASLPKRVQADVAGIVHAHYQRDYELLDYARLPPTRDVAQRLWTSEVSGVN
jgi:hypothetical protein